VRSAPGKCSSDIKPAWADGQRGLARRKIAGLNPLSAGTCGCVTAEVDYQVPSAAGEAATVPIGGDLGNRGRPHRDAPCIAGYAWT
jgi:hypothetical protein